jgi:hypothetical protein
MQSDAPPTRNVVRALVRDLLVDLVSKLLQNSRSVPDPSDFVRLPTIVVPC